MKVAVLPKFATSKEKIEKLQSENKKIKEENKYLLELLKLKKENNYNDYVIYDRCEKLYPKKIKSSIVLRPFYNNAEGLEIAEKELSLNIAKQILKNGNTQKYQLENGDTLFEKEIIIFIKEEK